MKIQELQIELEAKKVEARAFLDAKDVAKAEISMEEKRNLEKQIAMETELEDEEKRSLELQKSNMKASDVTMEKANEMRSLVKKVMGAKLTEEERAMVTSADNAPVIPKQFLNEIELLQKGYGSLKGYCDVKPVTKNEGTFPLIDMEQNALLTVLEGANIVDGTIITTDLPFKCEKVGLKTPLSAELIDDAEVEIESLVKGNFTIITTTSENSKIVKVIKDNATAVVGTDYTVVRDQIDLALPSVKMGLVTVTNSVGYAYLKNLADSTGQPLNLVTEMGGKYIFNSKELVVVDDAILAPTVAGEKIFYVLNFKEAVKFMDRKATTVERWRSPENDSFNISILERFAVCKGSVRSVKVIQF